MDELANRGNMAAADELVAADVVEHEEPPPGTPLGREGVKHFFTMLRAAFPDIRIAVEDQIAEGDKVVSRVMCRGTHRGEFMGVPSTGRQVVYEAIDIVRIVDGQIVEHWGVTDALGLLRQLGGIPR
jgi:steroid delta-isomerase-like uncharacterized protein